jgi:signal transduction histidine kinase
LLTEATDAIEPAFSQEAARTPPAAVLATIVRSAIAEALANIREHASPSEVTIIVQGDVDGVALDVLNDGSRAPSDNADDTKERNRSGVGLRLVDLQARSIGAQLEAGPVGNGEWRVRVRIPR